MLMEIISRNRARLEGKKRFFTGIACSQGHICERMVSNGDCRQCMRVRSDLRYKTDEAYRKKTKERLRKNYKSSPQKFRDRSSSNYLKTPENFRANSANSVARRRGIAGQISGSDILFILGSQNYECKYCGQSLKEEYEVDHAMPLSQGGPNVIENIQCLCHRCHSNKTANDIRQARLNKKSG